MDTSTKLPHLEAKWMASVRQYLHDVEGTIELDEDGVAALQREGDAFLMDMVISSEKFEPTQLQRINYCRMYLNVLLASDITNAAGTEIELNCYNGIPLITTTRHKVHQGRPNDYAWAQW
jgi:hypothetical protein